jgi:hypothetical protein
VSRLCPVRVSSTVDIDLVGASTVPGGGRLAG